MKKVTFINLVLILVGLLGAFTACTSTSKQKSAAIIYHSYTVVAVRDSTIKDDRTPIQVPYVDLIGDTSKIYFNGILAGSYKLKIGDHITARILNGRLWIKPETAEDYDDSGSR